MTTPRGRYVIPAGCVCDGLPVGQRLVGTTRFAMDATTPKPSPAKDATMADSDRMIAALKFLQTKLEPADWDRCVKILGGTDDGAAMDEPPPFRGMPEPGGKMYQGQAADAAARNRRLATHNAMKRGEAEFFRRFPDAARLRVA